jgi:hypothetical protein
VLLTTLLLAPSLGAAQTGSVRGRVHVPVVGVDLARVGPTVIYLDARHGRLDYPIPPAVPIIRQLDGSFEPTFRVVVAGQRVQLPNDDRIFHNVFSYSRPNDFDLGTYPRGQSRTIALRYPGFVRLYCSIHESMSASVFVAPSPYYDVADASGRFRIDRVPPGNYVLRTWSRRLPSATRQVRVAPGETARIEVEIGAPAPAGVVSR